MTSALDTLQNLRINRPVVLTIGVFDGVHLGHQHVIGGVVSRARERGALAVVLTFHPHPQLVLKPGLQPAYLITLEDRLRLIADLGVDLSVTLPFTRHIAQVSAADFVALLRRSLNPIELRVGHDFALGHKREGTIPVLRDLGRQAGFDVVAVESWCTAGTVVSSTRIREHIRAGAVDKAADLLGNPYELSGTVVVGDRRGRTLGYPTANLEIASELLLPADGVYAVFACLGSKRHPAVCNIGMRPSFGSARRTFEVHLLDFEGDLYDRQLTVRFIRRLRGEIRFPGVADLVRQISADALAARAILEEVSVAPCS